MIEEVSKRTESHALIGWQFLARLPSPRSFHGLGTVWIVPIEASSVDDKPVIGIDVVWNWLDASNSFKIGLKLSLLLAQ